MLSQTIFECPLPPITSRSGDRVATGTKRPEADVHDMLSREIEVGHGRSFLLLELPLVPVLATAFQYAPSLFVFVKGDGSKAAICVFILEM